MSRKPLKVSDGRPNTTEVADFLQRSSDLHFELQVLKLLREHSLTPEHSGHYLDPITGKPREFDLRVTKNNVIVTERPKDLTLDVNLNVECKNLSPARPLIVSCVENEAEDVRFLSVQFVSNVMQPLQHPMFSLANSRRIFDSFGAGFVSWVGCSLDQAQCNLDESGDRLPLSPTRGSELFDKWSQAVNAAVYSAGLGIESFLNRGGYRCDSLGLWSLPILVVPNDTLWVARYAPNSANPDVSLAPSVSYRLSLSIPDRTGHEVRISHMFILTVDGLKAFLANCICSKWRSVRSNSGP